MSSAHSAYLTPDIKYLRVGTVRQLPTFFISNTFFIEEAKKRTSDLLQARAEAVNIHTNRKNE